MNLRINKFCRKGKKENNQERERERKRDRTCDNKEIKKRILNRNFLKIKKY